MKVRVSPREKQYVFDALDQHEIDYMKGEFTCWYCEDCDKIYKIKPQEECPECDGKIKSISIGDFLGEKFNYCIERKKGIDLLNSLKEERVYLQLQAMYEFFGSNCALVLEGSFEDIIKEDRKRARGKARKMRQKNMYKEATIYLKRVEASYKQLLSIPATCMQLGISFIQVDNIDMLIDMLKYLDYKCGTNPKIRGKRKKVSDLLPAFVKQLMTTDGIGDKLALAIFSVVQSQKTFIHYLKRFPEKILAVKGLGKKKLENLQKDWNIE